MQKVKVKVHSVQKLEWKRTDGQTEADALPFDIRYDELYLGLYRPIALNI